MIMEQPDQARLHHTQKVGFALLVVFAVCVMVLGVLQFRTIIYGSVAYKPVQVDRDVSAINRLYEDDATRLQLIDTDQDGINDFEELNFYNTSPYLVDTDSDGMSDKAEIDQGTDPICPQGGDCELFNPGGVTDSAEVTLENPLLDGSLDETNALLGAVGEYTGGEPIRAQATSSVQGGVDISQLSQEERNNVNVLLSDPDMIRELLRNSSELSDEQIDAFSDAYLLDTVAQLLTQ